MRSANKTKRPRLGTKDDAVMATSTAPPPAAVATSAAASPGASQTQSVMNQILSMMTGIQNKLDTMQSDISAIKEKVDRWETIQDITWRFSAPKIPESYWDELGYDFTQIEDMNEFLEAFEEAVCCIREDKKGAYIRIGRAQGERLEYDEVLRPYWNEFAVALYKHRLDLIQTGTQLDVTNVEVPPSVLSILRPALLLNHFHVLELHNNNFGQAGVDFLLEYLKQNRQIIALRFHDNPIVKKQDVADLVKIIGEHPTLVDVSFNGSLPAISFGKVRDFIIRTPNLIKVDLSGNRLIRASGSKVKFDNLTNSNPNLQTLHLNNNEFNDDDFAMFARMLKNNTSLNRLDLSFNDYTEVGRQALIKALFDKESLNAVAKSNHTCDIYLHPNDFPHCSKIEKLFTLLCPPYENSVNTSLLEGVPLELVHHVLMFTQRYPEKQRWRSMTELLECSNPKDDDEDEPDDQSHSAASSQSESEGADEADEADGDEDANESDQVRLKSFNILYSSVRNWAVPLLCCSSPPLSPAAKKN